MALLRHRDGRRKGRLSLGANTNSPAVVSVHEIAPVLCHARYLSRATTYLPQQVGECASEAQSSSNRPGLTKSLTEKSESWVYCLNCLAGTFAPNPSSFAPKPRK